MDIDDQELKKPFKPEYVKWRVQNSFDTNNGKAGYVVPYLDSRRVEERLDRVFGLENWTAHYDINQMFDHYIVKCTIEIPDIGLTKEDFGEEVDSEYNDTAVLTAKAQAFKRACSALGVGRYLYLEAEEEFVYLKDSKDDLVNPVRARVDKQTVFFEKPQLPDNALPGGSSKSNSKRKPKKTKKTTNQEPTAPEEVIDNEQGSKQKPEQTSSGFNPEEETVAFGKFKGEKTWSELPKDYLEWMEGNFEGADEGWKQEAHDKTVKELERRSKTVDKYIKKVQDEADRLEVSYESIPNVIDGLFGVSDRSELKVRQAKELFESFQTADSFEDIENLIEEEE